MIANDQIQIRSICETCDGTGGWIELTDRRDAYGIQLNEYCPCTNDCKQGYVYRWVYAAEYLQQLLGHAQPQPVR